MEKVSDVLVNIKKRISEQLNAVKSLQSHTENEEVLSHATELYESGYRFYKNGKYAEAADFFTILTDIDAENPKYWMGLGASLQMLKNYEEALLAYATAGFLDHEDPEIFFHAANCCFSLNLASEGIQALETAETLARNKPNCGAMILQFTTLREMWSNKEKIEACSIL